MPRRKDITKLDPAERRILAARIRLGESIPGEDDEPRWARYSERWWCILDSYRVSFHQMNKWQDYPALPNGEYREFGHWENLLAYLERPDET